MKIYPLKDYIQLNYQGNSASFAKFLGVNRQKVHHWLKRGDRYIVESQTGKFDIYIKPEGFSHV